jgi:hypothetical protein
VDFTDDMSTDGVRQIVADALENLMGKDQTVLPVHYVEMGVAEGLPNPGERATR